MFSVSRWGFIAEKLALNHPEKMDKLAYCKALREYSDPSTSTRIFGDAFLSPGTTDSLMVRQGFSLIAKFSGRLNKR